METPQIASLVVSGASFAISGITAWLTLLRQGTVKMTRPTVLFFGPDGNEGEGLPKIYMRTLLYSTARRGKIVESMFVRLRRGESVQNFNVWVYGDDRMARGSGIYVGHDGLASNHHFLLPRDGTAYEFLPGDYSVQVFASLVGRRSPLLLAQVTLHLTQEETAEMKRHGWGCYFDWGPDSQKYHGHVDPPRSIKRDLPSESLSVLASMMSQLAADPMKCPTDSPSQEERSKPASEPVLVGPGVGHGER